MKNKVAILIPTKNRSDFLIRQLKYYASVDSVHPIYIGDSSDENDKEKILSIINATLYCFPKILIIQEKTAQKL